MTADYRGEEVGMSGPMTALSMCREIKTTDVTDGF